MLCFSLDRDLHGGRLLFPNSEMHQIWVISVLPVIRSLSKSY